MVENRLARERSPYLRQHASNPVDWHPWGEEAFARARREERPIFLSVGYAACHWCHVMEHESFEDEALARVLGETFVCVKVDREERPDVDALYMQAVHVLSGRGGWPMTVLLTPHGDPFWAGTYLPRAHLAELARRVGGLWSTDRERLEVQARAVADRVRLLGDGHEDLPTFEGSDAALLCVLDQALEAAFDERGGGYGSRPKFPPHAELLYLLDGASSPVGGDPSERAARLAQARRTLEAMEAGGLHDHVGAGFHRYSTDATWLLPHFEKMLYDNALLAQAYAHAAVLTGEERFAGVARRTLAWVRREMAVPGGGYASSLDADTDGEEGLTYTWTAAEIQVALAAGDGALALEAWGVEVGGNYRDEATGRATGRNVLHWARPLTEVAARRGEDTGALALRLDDLAGRLLAVRSRRPQPALDDKVITAWNGLLLSAFAQVGGLLGEADALQDGRGLARFLLTSARRDDGTLLRFPRASGPEIPGYAEDHVHLAEGLLDLADATGEVRWAEAARELADALLARFEDPDQGGFFTTSADAHERLFTRRKETFDGPIPSDNGVAARLLLRLAARTGEARYREAADRTLDAWRPLMGNPRAARGVAALHRALLLRRTLDRPTGPGPAGGDGRAQAHPVEAEAFAERREVCPGDALRLAVRVTLAPGWHAHPATPAEGAFVPTTLEVAGDGPIRLADLTWPDVAEPVLAPGAERLAVLAGTFWVRGTLLVRPDAAPGPCVLHVRLGLQPCRPAACLAPLCVDLVLPFAVGPVRGPARHGDVFPPA